MIGKTRLVAQLALGCVVLFGSASLARAAPPPNWYDCDPIARYCCEYEAGTNALVGCWFY